ncbi:MAG: TIGR04282 family arsenosugar biosynthesis glycosyltransferase [Saprospiraceae bacterium]|jgi:rSAM/selenodomain-associated transferase 1|nr:TIGR04282 family arsenosugar biosynthesis glycosyltransferase [Saprospiraceae bacterium]
MPSVLLIFIKNPVLGKVKTRLARTVGDAEALRIYLLLLEKTRLAALGARAERRLYYSDRIEAGDVWAGADFKKYMQHGPDLGARMAGAFRQSFADGADRAVIIGSDCPELDGVLLNEAFSLLERHDFVLGPTPDGGYYLLGMRAFEPSVFEGIAWSTESVRAATLEKIGGLGKTCALLPERSDVDTEADWRKFEAGF